MGRNFHEALAQDAVKPPSERSTGLVFAGVAFVVALLWRNDPTVCWSALGVAAILTLVSLAAPRLLGPLNRIWFQFGLLLHRVVNPIVMLALFAFVFVPAGALMRIWYDPLGRRRDPEANTYWIDCETNKIESSMRNQF